MEKAAFSGHIECSRFSVFCLWMNKLCKNGALNGNLFLQDRWCPRNEGTCYAAVHNGHLKCLCKSSTCESVACGCCWDETTAKIVAQTGRLDVFKLILEDGCPWDVNECLEAAASNGHDHITRFISELIVLSENDVL